MSSGAENMHKVIPLFPEPGPSQDLKGLYLETDLKESISRGKPYVFTNFVASLDGRIAVRSGGNWKIPPQIKTAEDQCLYQELSAQADVILITARHARAIIKNDELQPFPYTGNTDQHYLSQWRLQHGRSAVPAIAVVCRNLNFSGVALCKKLGCPIYCITGSDATEDSIRRMQDEGVTVVVASETALVPGVNVVAALTDWGFELIYSVAGPVLMHALLQDKLLNRLYLTQVEVLVGGEDFVTFSDSFAQSPGATLALFKHFRCREGSNAGQLLSVYDFFYDS